MLSLYSVHKLVEPFLPDLIFQPQSMIALWLLLISLPAEGKTLS